MKTPLPNSPDVRGGFIREVFRLEAVRLETMRPLLKEAANTILSLARRAYDDPGLIINPETRMAWRPYENLIDGELDNRTPGKVIGWIRFCRMGRRPLKVKLDLGGDFHEDIRGKVVRLQNAEPKDRNLTLDRKGTYMEGFASVQCGEVGDITAGISLGPWSEDLSQKLLAQQEIFWKQAGIPAEEREKQRQEIADSHRDRIDQREAFYPHVDYPYIEWYSEANGRVVLELDPEQLEIIGGKVQPEEKTAEKLFAEHRRREQSMMTFLKSIVGGHLRESRRQKAAKPEKAIE